MSSSIRYTRSAILVTGKTNNAFGVDIDTENKKRVMIDSNGLTLGNKENDADVYVNEIEGEEIKIDSETKEASKTALPSSYAVMKAISDGGLEALWPFTLEVTDGAVPEFAIQYNQNKSKTKFMKFYFRYDLANASVGTGDVSQLSALDYFASLPIDSIRVFPYVYFDGSHETEIEALGLNEEEKVYLRQVPPIIIALHHNDIYAYKYVSGGSTYEDFEYEYCYYNNDAFYHTATLGIDGYKFESIDEVPEPLFYVLGATTPTESKPFKINSEDDMKGIMQMKVTVGTEDTPVVFTSNDINNVLSSICYMHYSTGDEKTKPYFVNHLNFDFDFANSYFPQLDGASISTFKQQGCIAIRNIQFENKELNVQARSMFNADTPGIKYVDGKQESNQGNTYITFKDVSRNSLTNPIIIAANQHYLAPKQIFDEMIKFSSINIDSLNYLFAGIGMNLMNRGIFDYTYDLEAHPQVIDFTNNKIHFNTTSSVEVIGTFTSSIVTSIKFPNNVQIKPSNMIRLCQNIKYIESITGLHYWDTSACTNFAQALNLNKHIDSLNIANWTFESITAADKLESFINLSNFDTLYIKEYNTYGKQVKVDSDTMSITIYGGNGNAISQLFPGSGITSITSTEGYVEIATGEFTTTAPASGNEDEYISGVLKIELSRA